MRELIAHTAQYGVTVHVAQLPPGTLGLYDHTNRRIWLTLGLTPAETRSVLAHELGHAHYGHDCDSPKNERQARRYAATLLIDPAEYARLEQINPDLHWLADEFTVTTEIIDDYTALCLTRLQGVTYTHPRHGIRQWAHRQTVGA